MSISARLCGATIREQRLQRGLTMGEVADESGLDESTISLYENGQRNKPETLEAIQEAIYRCVEKRVSSDREFLGGRAMMSA